jgi:hypothetical protein
VKKILISIVLIFVFSIPCIAGAPQFPPKCCEHRKLCEKGERHDCCAFTIAAIARRFLLLETLKRKTEDSIILFIGLDDLQHPSFRFDVNVVNLGRNCFFGPHHLDNTNCFDIVVVVQPSPMLLKKIKPTLKPNGIVIGVYLPRESSHWNLTTFGLDGCPRIPILTVSEYKEKFFKFGFDIRLFSLRRDFAMYCDREELVKEIEFNSEIWGAECVPCNIQLLADCAMQQSIFQLEEHRIVFPFRMLQFVIAKP